MDEIGRAEMLWNDELARRQDAHVAEVWRRLHVWPRHVLVDLGYGPGREATGVIEELDGDLVQLRLAEARTRWVPLLQIESIDGVMLETAKKLERPPVDGVVEIAVGPSRST